MGFSVADGSTKQRGGGGNQQLDLQACSPVFMMEQMTPLETLRHAPLKA